MLITVTLVCIYSLAVLWAITPALVEYQLAAIVLGYILYFLIRRIDTQVFQKFWTLWYIVCIILLLTTLFGPEIRGSHRWIDLFGQNIQPSEVVKPVLIAVFAAIISGFSTSSFRSFLMFGALCIPPFLMVFKQPDLGNAIVYSCVFAGLILMSRFHLRYSIIPLLLIVAVMPFLWHFLADYQKVRFTAFVNPGYDVQGVGYNARQALIAVGSGGLWGKGLGQGTQSKLSFLPEYHTDFIFASTVEQLGFIGGSLLLFLYTVLFFQLFKAARNSADEFQRLTIYGMLVQLFAQVFINVGMNVGIVPITGITLPLFSYGGSSVVATFIGIGILASFKRHAKQPIAIR